MPRTRSGNWEAGQQSAGFFFRVRSARCTSDATVENPVLLCRFAMALSASAPSIALSYRRDTTDVPSFNGNHDCKMTMLATAPGTLLDSSLWRIYEEVVFSHGSARSIDLAVSRPSANSAFTKRSKAF